MDVGQNRATLGCPRENQQNGRPTGGQPGPWFGIRVTHSLWKSLQSLFQLGPPLSSFGSWALLELTCEDLGHQSRGVGHRGIEAVWTEQTRQSGLSFQQSQTSLDIIGHLYR